MRCRDAKLWLNAQQKKGNLEHPPHDAQPEISAIEEHLKQCRDCRAYELRLKRLNSLFIPAGASKETRSISTERIMQAVQHQRRISQQLEDIRTKQQYRVVHLRRVCPLIALSFFALELLAVVLFFEALMQPDLMIKILSLLSGTIDAAIAIGQYVQSALLLVTRNTWLLSGVAFLIVVMMGMWLRLMRYPQHA